MPSINETAPLDPSVAGACLQIDLTALQENYLALKAMASPAECSAAIKADAYGLGVTEVVPTLTEAGCRVFFVALLEEAHDVLAVAPGATVYVLNGLIPGTAAAFIRAGIRPVLGSLEEIHEWSACCRAEGGHFPAALHVDTGINRLGLEAGEVDQFVEDSTIREGLEISLVMSHLACADDVESTMNETQRKRFASLLARLPRAAASLANTAGITHGNTFHFDLVRPGIGIYGGRAVSEGPNPMKPVVYLHGRIMQVRTLKKGETIGYGASWAARRNSRIAIVGVGYADGYFRNLGGIQAKPGAQVFLGGKFAPVVGRVSMDMITIDVTDIEPSQAVRGAPVELLGRNITVDDLAEAAGTIGYEILTSLGSRYARVYSRA